MSVDRTELLNQIREDEELKVEITKILLEDKKFVAKLAREVFTLPVQTIGLHYFGTVGEVLLNRKHKNGGG